MEPPPRSPSPIGCLTSGITQPQPSRPNNPAAHQYRLASDDIVQVFHLAHAPTPRILQEMATDVRTIAAIPRLFTYTESSIITTRGDASQIAMAEWLVNQLDQPPNQPAPHEYRPSGTGDDIVRIFFLTHAESPQRLQQIIVEIRSATHVMRMLPYTMSQAIVARGTAAQIALTSRLITEQDR